MSHSMLSRVYLTQGRWLFTVHALTENSRTMRTYVPRSKLPHVSFTRYHVPFHVPCSRMYIGHAENMSTRARHSRTSGTRASAKTCSAHSNLSGLGHDISLFYGHFGNNCLSTLYVRSTSFWMRCPHVWDDVLQMYRTAGKKTFLRR